MNLVKCFKRMKYHHLMKCLINKLKESEGEDIKKLIKKKILSIKLGLTPLGLQIINDILYYIKI